MTDLTGFTPKVIGQVSVDSGLIYIGDPCYVLHKNEPPKSIGKDWDDFCNTITHKNYHEFNHDLGHSGLGVVSSTFHGDGLYNVIGFFHNDNKRASFVAIDFAGVFKGIEKI
jgi:hypothetical protein